MPAAIRLATELVTAGSPALDDRSMNSVPTNAQRGPTTGQEATSDLATKTIGTSAPRTITSR
jgi:hypothetical protein